MNLTHDLQIPQNLTDDEKILLAPSFAAHDSLTPKERAFAHSRKIQELVHAPKVGSFYQPPKPYFRTNGDGTFEVIYVSDLRYSQFKWQKEQEILHKHPFENRPCRFQTKQEPRRHGKTHKEVFSMVAHLISCFLVPLLRPIGAFYCVDRGQAIRNTWRIFKMAVAQIPGVIIKEAEKEILNPRPHPNDPDDFATIYFFGIRGGSGNKRGGYYDIVTMDEVEFIDLDFVQEVAFGSTFDRNGHVRLLGTPRKMGRLSHWLDMAKKRVKMRTDIANGAIIPKDKIYADMNEWSFSQGDIYSRGLYSPERIAIMKSIFSEEVFNREFLCIDDTVASGFFHREQLERAEEAGNISAMVGVDQNLPLRVYFDLGLGTKTNRMAFSIC